MMSYIRRQHAKKLSNGASQEELDQLLRFPEPIPPAKALTPDGQWFRLLLRRILIMIQRFLQARKASTFRITNAKRSRTIQLYTASVLGARRNLLHATLRPTTLDTMTTEGTTRSSCMTIWHTGTKSSNRLGKVRLGKSSTAGIIKLETLWRSK